MAGIGRLALAAIGILAYQNRDKLGEWLKTGKSTGDGASDPHPGDSIFEQLKNGRGGLGDLLDTLRSGGLGAAVDSWVGKDTNQPVAAGEVAEALDERTIDEIVRQTGLSRDEILRRLAVELPGAVDNLTPEGVWNRDEEISPTLLDPLPAAAPKMSGAAQPGFGVSNNPLADRNTEGPRVDGASPRPTEDPIV